MSENYGFLMHTEFKIEFATWDNYTFDLHMIYQFIKNINRIMQSLDGLVTFKLN